MFEPNEEIAEMVDRLYRECGKLNEGDILTHEMIRPILGCEPNTGHWQQCVRKVRDRLQQDRGIAVLPEKPIGYRLLTAAQAIVDVPVYRMKRAKSQVRRFRKTMTSLSTRKLTAHQKRLHLFLVDHAKATELSIRREMREQQQTIRPTPVQPRRPLPVPQPQREAVAQ